jgi:hypothetical protein
LVPEREDRSLARPRRQRPPEPHRPLRPLRQRGDLSQRSRRPRHRDLLGPATRGLGRTGRRTDDDVASGCRISAR